MNISKAFEAIECANEMTRRHYPHVCRQRREAVEVLEVDTAAIDLARTIGYNQAYAYLSAVTALVCISYDGVFAMVFWAVLSVWSLHQYSKDGRVLDEWLPLRAKAVEYVSQDYFGIDEEE